MSVTVEVPADLGDRLETDLERTRSELQVELAVALYAAGELALRRAALVAGLEVTSFEQVLRRKKVPIPYTLSDWENDLAYARGHR